MDYKEEQTQELEVLESIYPDELDIKKSDYPNINFDVTLNLELSDEPMAASLSKQHSMLINFIFPENYPDEAPLIKITPQEISLKDEDDDEDDEDDDEDEIEFDDHGNKILKGLQNLPDMISFKDYIPELQLKLEEQIENDMLIGMQMCFALISSIKENCESWYFEQLRELDRLHELEVQKREKKEQAKFIGTKVTKESYLSWRTKFRNEMNLDQRDELRRQQAHHGRLTGRQMFEQGLVENENENENDEEGDEEPVDEIKEGIQNL
ncbi:Gir2p NDAI_0J00940 [Naumovozyma dairenensis CBS 421]|uniref:RWD domain-containing protein n=1 Tax=Naumovozyma dairenensis (strain ATCC 10597 / BCRC 20456 / CBS 421 / NBRC 0211 / NRRL Y-12639) TaxID=1071378 RepID=G0WGQ8_NAUDC|nr:hypothetical protein NDAI_0J00940 [Naumovozyma dairenensis CBS 421]CCD26986.1 hypothetical protein NDAI_0J00940 [Naumovozyma dairenensis CBS 421]